jgi:hypothetical protein
MSKFGVILLLDHTVAEEMIRYSQALTGKHPAYMALGENAPPHITLLHAECDLTAAQEWWNATKKIGSSLNAERAGLVLDHIPVGDEYVPEGGVSCGVSIVRTSTLNEAHGIALNGAQNVNARPLGAFGENFRPHATLTIFKAFPDGPIPFDRSAIAGGVTGRLALGELGLFGTFPRIIAEL